jgi:hypothetical protein
MSGSHVMKLALTEASGSYASLLRDVVVQPQPPHRNFLDSPEIVYDLNQQQHIGSVLISNASTLPRHEHFVGHGLSCASMLVVETLKVAITPCLSVS